MLLFCTKIGDVGRVKKLIISYIYALGFILDANALLKFKGAFIYEDRKIYKKSYKNGVQKA